MINTSIPDLRERIPGRFRPSPNAVFRRVGNEAVLVLLRRNVGDLDWVHTLTPVAVSVWQLLDGQRGVDDIAALLCEEYDVDERVASDDVSELLDSLREGGLIVDAE